MNPTLLALKDQGRKYREALSIPRGAYATALLDSVAQWSKIAPWPDQRQDSWQNLLTGIGTPRDKVTATLFQQDNQLDFPTLEALYHLDDMAARIVDAVPEQMFREGFDLKIDGDIDAQHELSDAMHALEVREVFEYASILARLYGGGAVFVGAQDGADPQDPLIEDGIKTVDFLQVLDRYSLWPNTWYSDPGKPGFGQPETYRIFTPTVAGVTPPVNVIIHESRLILFPGARTSIRKRRVNFGWEDSVLQRVYSVLMSFSLHWTSCTHLLSDAAQGVYSVKNLLDIIAGGNKEALMDRMTVVDESRSTARMVLVDAENEKFERIPTPFTGIPEMLDRSVQRLASAARMPVTVLMGVSPAGLNATGESDMRQWYDQISVLQKHVVKPRVKRLAKILMMAKDGPTGGKVLDVGVHFPPLWQESPKDKAATRLAVSQTDDIYLSYGVLLPEEVRESRFGGDGYSEETTIQEGLGTAALSAAQQAQLGRVAPGEQPKQVSTDPNYPSPTGGPGIATSENTNAALLKQKKQKEPPPTSSTLAQPKVT